MCRKIRHANQALLSVEKSRKIQRFFVKFLILNIQAFQGGPAGESRVTGPESQRSFAHAQPAANQPDNV